MRLVIQSVYQVGSKSNCDLVNPERSPNRSKGRLSALLPAACAQAAEKLMLVLDTQRYEGTDTCTHDETCAAPHKAWAIMFPPVPPSSLKKDGNIEQLEATDLDAKVNTAEKFNFLESCFARVEN